MKKNKKQTRFQEGYVCWSAVKCVFVEISADSVTILTHAGTALCGGMTLVLRKHTDED